MAVVTLYRLSEEITKVINGGQIKTASNVNIARVKIAIGQVINAILKVDYMSSNLALGEIIPNGTVLGWYENIAVSTWNGKSKCTLPIKPIKLPRNMGIWAIYPRYETNGNYEFDKEYIPLQMGQGALIKSQPLLNDLLGQVGYENFGNEVIFTKDVKSLFPDMVVAMRLAIMDISLYDDYDPLPILPEQEFEVKNQVIKFFTQEPTPDMLVDATSAEQKGTPITQQKQSS